MSDINSLIPHQVTDFQTRAEHFDYLLQLCGFISGHAQVFNSRWTGYSVVDTETFVANLIIELPTTRPNMLNAIDNITARLRGRVDNATSSQSPAVATNTDANDETPNADQPSSALPSTVANTVLPPSNASDGQGVSATDLDGNTNTSGTSPGAASSSTTPSTSNGALSINASAPPVQNDNGNDTPNDTDIVRAIAVPSTTDVQPATTVATALDTSSSVNPAPAVTDSSSVATPAPTTSNAPPAVKSAPAASIGSAASSSPSASDDATGTSANTGHTPAPAGPGAQEIETSTAASSGLASGAAAASANNGSTQVPTATAARAAGTSTAADPSTQTLANDNATPTAAGNSQPPTATAATMDTTSANNSESVTPVPVQQTATHPQHPPQSNIVRCRVKLQRSGAALDITTDAIPLSEELRVLRPRTQPLRRQIPRALHLEGVDVPEEENIQKNSANAQPGPSVAMDRDQQHKDEEEEREEGPTAEAEVKPEEAQEGKGRPMTRSKRMSTGGRRAKARQIEKGKEKEKEKEKKAPSKGTAKGKEKDQEVDEGKEEPIEGEESKPTTKGRRATRTTTAKGSATIAQPIHTTEAQKATILASNKTNAEATSSVAPLADGVQPSAPRRSLRRTKRSREEDEVDQKYEDARPTRRLRTTKKRTN